MIIKKLSYFICVIVFTLYFANTAHAQLSALNPTPSAAGPWKQDQLLSPPTLAAQLKTNAPHAVILNIGKVEDIKDAKHIGPVTQKEGLEKLTKEVAKLSRNTELVIYCGCCPLETKCPNVKPAFLELKRLGFTNVKVLNLATNLETNWIKEGYPLAAK